MKNEALKILVVEDEFITISNLKSILVNEGYIVSGIAKSANEALKILLKETVDLIIVDINIKGEHDGIWLADKINSMYEIPHIFLTAYSDKKTIKNAADTNPYAYLIKPFTKETIFSSIQIAIQQFTKNNEINVNTDIANQETTSDFLFSDKFFFIKDRGIFHKIDFQDILYASADMKYIEIYLKQGKRHTFRCNITDLVKILPQNAFFRSHRSYVVNLEQIVSIGDNFIMLSDNKIPLASSRKKELLNLFRIK